MKKLLSLILLCCCIWAMQGQTTTRTIGTTLDDEFRSIIRAANGDWILAGTRQNGTDLQFLVMRTNATGTNVIWSRTYGSNTQADNMVKVIEEPNGNIVFMGQSNTAVSVYRLASTGVVSAVTNPVRIPAQSATILPIDFIRLANGNFVIGGSCFIGGTSTWNSALICVHNNLGSIVWENQYAGSTSADWINSLMQAANGEIIAVGAIRSGLFHDGTFQRFNATDGSLISSFIYERGRNEGFGGVVQVANGDFIILGAEKDDNSGTAVNYNSTNIKLMRVSSTGTYIWERAYRNNGLQTGEHDGVLTLQGNELIVAGITNRLGTNPMTLGSNAGVQVYMAGISLDGLTVNWTKLNDINTANTANTQIVRLVTDATSATIGVSTNNRPFAGETASFSRNFLMATNTLDSTTTGCLEESFVFTVDTALAPTRTTLTPTASTMSLDPVNPTFVDDAVQGNTATGCLIDCQNFTASRTITTAAYCASSASISLVNATFPVNVVVTGTNGGTSSNINVNASPFTLNNLCPGSYNVILTTNDDCKDTLTWTVENLCQDFSASRTITTVGNCASSASISLVSATFPVNVAVTGTNGGTSSNINVNTSPFTLNNLCPGSYSVILTTNSGCKDTLTWTVENLCQGFNVSITAINLTYPVTSCGNNVDILIGGGAASLPAQVQSNWIGGGAAPLIANSNTFNVFAQCPQTFHDIITSAQGCKDTIYYVIPTCIDTNICVGSSIILSAWDDKFHAPFTTGNQITGNWLVDGVPAGSGATLNISPTANTNYIFNGQLNNVVNGVSTFVQFVNFCVNVNLTTPPTLTATASPATICAGQTSTLSVTGGASNAMYRWYRMPATNLGTGMTKVVAPSVTTTYYAIVDCAPCTDTAWVTVNVVQPTQATITGPSAICGTQAVSLTATGGSTYAWKLSPFASIVGTAATLNVASVSTTRTYTVTATNAPCPTTTASHSITVNPIPNVTLPLPTGCRIVGQPLTFNATSTSNIATWNWGNNPNTPTGVTSTANNSAATYTMVSGTNTNVVSLSVTDVNGCSKATTVSVSPNNLVATIAQPIQSGACNSRKFTVSLSGLTSAAGTVVSYNWVFKNLTQNTQVTQTTTTNTATQLFAAPGIDVYEVCVTLTTSLGCTTSVCMTPNLPACSCNIAANFCTTAGTPPASGTAIPVIFNNTSTGGGATGLQYVWNWGDNTPNTTLTSTAATTHNFASTLTSSNVELTVTGTSNGMQCCQKVNIPVTIPRPCPITSTNVTGFNYRQNATGSITFYSNIVAPTGCVYAWNFGNSTTSTAVSPTYTYPVAGTYTACLTITHTATGCSKTFCQTIIAAPAPNCNLIPRYTATRCTGAPLDISFNVVNNTSGIAPSNVTYSWNFGDGTTAVSTSPSISHTFPSIGNYVVCLQKVTANCTTNVCHTFNVQMPTYANCSPAPTGLKTTKGDDKCNEEELVPLDGNNWLLNKVEIVPNPAKNITNLHFSLANNAEVRMEAYSMEGKGIWEKTTSLPAGQQNEEINLSGWAAGMYIIRVTTGEEVQNIKLVVEN